MSQTVDLDQARRDAERAQAHAAELRARAEEAEGRARDLRQFYELAERLYGSAPPPNGRASSRALGEAAAPALTLPDLAGMEAVAAARIILVERSGVAMRPVEVARIMLERGWTTDSDDPRHVVASALGRLEATDPRVTKPRYGHYMFMPSDT